MNKSEIDLPGPRPGLLCSILVCSLVCTWHGWYGVQHPGLVWYGVQHPGLVWYGVHHPGLVWNDLQIPAMIYGVHHTGLVGYVVHLPGLGEARFASSWTYLVCCVPSCSGLVWGGLFCYVMHHPAVI